MRPVVIAGGGPAGAATAIALARAGITPLVVEREPAAREKVCGEFLAQDAADGLRALGLDLAGLGAVPIAWARYGAGRRIAEFRLPFAAWGLPRAILDEALLRAAEAAGAQVLRGVAVSAAERIGAGWRLRLGATDTVEAPVLVLATGKHDLRGLRRPTRGGALGLKLPLLSAAPEAAVTLLACAGGYAGLQPRGEGGANLCAALDPRAPGVMAAARSAEAFLDHVRRGSALAERLLAGATPGAARPMAVAGVPYGFVHRGGGPFRVGDQMAVVPSIAGDGVAMALRSGIRAARAIQLGVAAEAQHAAWAKDIGTGLRLASLLAAAAQRMPGPMAAAMALAPGACGWLACRTRLGAAWPGG